MLRMAQGQLKRNIKNENNRPCFAGSEIGCERYEMRWKLLPRCKSQHYIVFARVTRNALARVRHFQLLLAVAADVL